jgi:DNA-binding phage protein
MTTEKSQFWTDLDLDLEDPEFRAEFVLQSVRIQTVDHVINALDDARMSKDLSKAELARAIGADPAAVRRLFTAHGNPTLNTLSDLAAALGLRITIEPMPQTEARAVASVLVAETKTRTATKAPTREGKREPTAPGRDSADSTTQVAAHTPEAPTARRRRTKVSA